MNEFDERLKGRKEVPKRAEPGGCAKKSQAKEAAMPTTESSSQTKVDE